MTSLAVGGGRGRAAACGDCVAVCSAALAAVFPRMEGSLSTLLLPSPPGTDSDSDGDGDKGKGVVVRTGISAAQLLLTPPNTAAADRDNECMDDKSDDGGYGGSFFDEPEQDNDMFADTSSESASVGQSSRPGRGRYSRTESMRRRSKWRPWVQHHMQRIGEIITSTHCGPNCPGCDIASFATKALAERCAQESFGDAVLISGARPPDSRCSSRPHT